jgi:hypothetical protein
MSQNHVSPVKLDNRKVKKVYQDYEFPYGAAIYSNCKSWLFPAAEKKNTYPLIVKHQ